MCHRVPRGGRAGVKKGMTVAVIGDGAVACAGSWRRNGSARTGSSCSAATPTGRSLAREFGATDIIDARGDEAVQAVLELTGGFGADAALECVGTARSTRPRSPWPLPVRRWQRGGPPRSGAMDRLLPQRRLARRPGPGPALPPRLLSEVPGRLISPGRVFDYDPTWPTSPTPTPHGRTARHQVTGPSGSDVLL